jgi:hypothetical protein
MPADNLVRADNAERRKYERANGERASTALRLTRFHQDL